MRVLLCAAAFALTVGCASTKTVTYTNPDFAGHRFAKVLVFVKLEDVSVRTQMEDAFVAQLRKAGVAAYSATTVWAAAEDAQSREARVAELGIDSVLVVQLRSSGMTAPQTYYAGGGSSGNTNINSHGYATTTAYDPMNAYSGRNPAAASVVTTKGSPHAVFAAGLVDVSTRRSAWIDQAATSGSSGASFETVRASFIETTVSDLLAANVLLTAPSSR
jgi:hypothetical protein